MNKNGLGYEFLIGCCIGGLIVFLVFILIFVWHQGYNSEDPQFAQAPYRVVSEVVNPQTKKHIGTIFQTTNFDDTVTLYVLMDGNRVLGISAVPIDKEQGK